MIPMTNWMDARRGWQLVLLYWAAVLLAGLLGGVSAALVLGGPSPFPSNAAILLPGSLFVAVCATCGTLRARRR